MKKIYFVFLSLICLFSLVVNAFYVQSLVSHKHQMQYSEDQAMVRVSGTINQANRWMFGGRKGDTTAAISRLTEASGVLWTLNNQHFDSLKQSTRSNLYNVAYYLHFQGTSNSHNGLSQFMMNATQLLQSHISNGRYNTAYFSSDMAKLDRMLPKSFRCKNNMKC